MLKVVNCLVCDDVRQENTGKFILVGVYGHDLHVLQATQVETATMLNLWIELQAATDADSKIQLRAVVERNGELNDNVAFSLDLHLPDRNELTQILAVQFQCRMDFSHALRFEFRISDQDWQFARRLNIIAPASAAVPPNKVDG